MDRDLSPHGTSIPLFIRLQLVAAQRHTAGAVPFLPFPALAAVALCAPHSLRTRL